MLPCEPCQQQLLSYLYDLLEPPERQELDAHLQSCTPCQEALAQARQQQGLFAEAASHALAASVPQPCPLVELLTEREREVWQLLLHGASNREIARHLVLSMNTVKKHVLNICRKLNVRSRAQVIAKARTLQLL